MKPRDLVLEQIHHRPTRPVPFTLSFEGDVADRLDAHYGGGRWRDGLVPYIASAAPVDTMAKEPIEGGLARDVFGTLWRLDKRPFHLQRPAMAAPSFDGYDFPSPERFYKAETEAAARKTLAARPDSFRVAGISWGLFESSWGIRGFQNALMDAAAEPDFYEELLERITDLFMAFVEKAVAMPVDAVMFGDDWGDQRGVILGPERWRRMLKPRWARLYQAVHDAGKFTISHCCGSVVDIMPDIIEIGLDVLESVQPEARGMNPYELKRRWGDRITFWGGLGSQSTIPFATPDAIRAEVRRLVREMGKGGGYMLAPAKSLQPETPTENAVAVLESFVHQEGG